MRQLLHVTVVTCYSCYRLQLLHVTVATCYMLKLPLVACYSCYMLQLLHVKVPSCYSCYMLQLSHVTDAACYSCYRLQLLQVTVVTYCIPAQGSACYDPNCMVHHTANMLLLMRVLRYQR